ncbi:hypothetical protein [Xanthomonas oryzae]|uniref:hypothetical protein n=1 Tax=Xanthomonas oryzae TaxID=347 RepID=UPI0013EF7857|nr:hypothetical protein [Xanthomonas oryzae]
MTVTITITITMAITMAITTTVSTTIATAVSTTMATAVSTAIAATITTAVTATIRTATIITGLRRWRITNRTRGTAGIHTIALFTTNGEIVETSIVTTGTTTIGRTCTDQRGASRTLRFPISCPAVNDTPIRTVKSAAI